MIAHKRVKLPNVDTLTLRAVAPGKQLVPNAATG